MKPTQGAPTGPCTQLLMSPRAPSRSGAAPCALPCSQPRLSCCLQLNHCPGVWQAALCPASPGLFAIAPRLGRATGSSDTRHCQQMLHPASTLPRSCQLIPCPWHPSMSAPTAPMVPPKAPHTPWGVFPPQTVFVPTEQRTSVQSSLCGVSVSATPLR